MRFYARKSSFLNCDSQIMDVKKIRSPLWIILWTALCFSAFSFHIDSIPPYHTDENFYVESVRNMVETGDYITPVYHEKNRFAKPPLYYWLTALNYKLLGPGFVSARLVSASMGALCIAATFFLVRRLFDEKTAWLSAFILPGLYMHFQISRWAITDMTMALFVLCAMYCFLRSADLSRSRIAWLYMFYFFIGLGFLTKGPPAILIPVSVLFVCRLIQGAKNQPQELRIASGVILILTMNAPWFLTMWILHGDEFKNHILGAEIKNRLVHDIPFSFYYFGVLIRYNFPWSLFLISSLIYFFKADKKSGQEKTQTSFLKKAMRSLDRQRENPSRLLCLVWIFVPIILFTLFRIEHSRYILPVSPAIAALLAHFFIELQKQPGEQTQYFKIPFYMTQTVFGIIAIASILSILILQPLFPLPLPVLLLPIALIIGIILLYLLYRRQESHRLILATGILQLLLLTLVSGSLQTYLDRSPMKKFAEIILNNGSGKENLVLYRSSSHRARLGIMTAQSAYNFEDPDSLKSFILSPGRKYIVMKKYDWEKSFSDLALVKLDEDFFWKKQKKDKKIIQRILTEGILNYKDKLLETYLLFSYR